MSGRRELVEQLLREVHYLSRLIGTRPDVDLVLERHGRCYSYLHAASLATARPIIDDVPGFVAAVLDGRAITNVTEDEFARQAADHLYSLAEVPA